MAAQWVFGVNPRLGDGLLEEEQNTLERQHLISPGDDWKKKQTIRIAARDAFLKTQATDALARANLGKPRVHHGDFNQGQFVYLYRKCKVTGGMARRRPEVGEWIGPGVIVGKEGDNYWVSRGGRCLLCAKEHLRSAESEELGGSFQARALKDDLAQLIENIDMEDEEVFADARGQSRLEVGDDPGAHGEKRKDDSRVPARRMKQKGNVEMVPREIEQEVPELNEAMLANDERVSRALQKQADKELKWGQIPEEEKPLYKEAEQKQWKEHLKYEAVRVIPPEESKGVRARVRKERILKARFAYRDKNCAKRREDPKVPCKPKARLCVGGHRDPDLRDGNLATEAPTASKMAITVLCLLTSMFQWELAAGDIEAAFLNGDEARRDLYFEPPADDLEGVPPGSLIEIVKGVFGLSTSPRLWWNRLASTILELQVEVNGEKLSLEQHDLDQCLFLLRGSDGTLKGVMATHVDDILLSAPHDERMAVQKALGDVFPIDSWDEAEKGLEYCGISVKQEEGEVHLSQEHYVNSRLQTVEIPRGCEPGEEADDVAKMDNQSTIGALSWLASQSRPDLQAGVSLAQRTQKSPTYGMIKQTNQIVRMAQQAKDMKIVYKQLGQVNDLAILVYHDSSWANAPREEGDQNVEENYDGGVYSQLGYVVLIVNKQIFHGATGEGLVACWKSHACPRVCRSTFAAERMAALEGWEAAIAFRAMFRGCFKLLAEPNMMDWLPITSATDCKSLFDSVHRVGGPRAPAEKRLILDLAALRQMIRTECSESGRNDLKEAFRWVPTTHQIADNLTKVIAKCKDWWLRLQNLNFGNAPQDQ